MKRSTTTSSRSSRPKTAKRPPPDNLRDIPNIGPAMVRDFALLRIATPADLVGRDPYALYDQLCEVTGVRHDPCVLDTFISAVRYVEGAPAKPWFAYTAERKATLAARNATRKR